MDKEKLVKDDALRRKILCLDGDLMTMQVEQNVDFVRRKRADVPFSPKDQESVESFLQLEKSSSDAPFTQYYKSILQKSASRHLATAEKFSNNGVNVGRNLEKRKVNQVIDGRREGKKGKKQRA